MAALLKITAPFAEPRDPGVGHGARQAVGAVGPARAARCRCAAWAGARGGRAEQDIGRERWTNTRLSRRNWSRCGRAGLCVLCASSHAGPSASRRSSIRWSQSDHVAPGRGRPGRHQDHGCPVPRIDAPRGSLMALRAMMSRWRGKAEDGAGWCSSLAQISEWIVDLGGVWSAGARCADEARAGGLARGRW